MQRTAFRDKISRRGNSPRRLFCRKPTFILFNKLRNEIPIFPRATPFLLSFYHSLFLRIEDLRYLAGVTPYFRLKAFIKYGTLPSPIA